MIEEGLSRNLPNKEDKELLAGLLQAMRKGGKDGAESHIEELVEKITGES